MLPHETKGRVNCDTPGCGFSAEITDSELPQWLNKPCPKCGENLLTQEDFDSVSRLLHVIDQAGSIAKALNLPDKNVIVKAKTNTKGGINIDVSDIMDDMDIRRN